MTPYTHPQPDNPPIGIFDSGLGGLTVMRPIKALLPKEPLLYFGDTSRVPYGNKSPETIVRYALEAASFFKSQGVKALVVACNTASSYALEALEESLKIPVLGVIIPGAEAAVKATQSGRIGVLGTKATILSGAYQSEIGRRLPEAALFPVACPLFVPHVEERFIHHPATRLIVKEYLAPLKSARIDTLLLGCTHYPILAPLIQEEMGSGVQLIDSGMTTAIYLESLLKKCALSTSSSVPLPPQFFVSDDPDKFRMLGQLFLGEPIASCHLLREELAPL
jgi:glutamate racemase